eukprot:15159_3
MEYNSYISYKESKKSSVRLDPIWIKSDMPLKPDKLMYKTVPVMDHFSFLNEEDCEWVLCKCRKVMRGSKLQRNIFWSGVN